MFQDVMREGFFSKLGVVGRNQVLADWWTEDLSFWLAIGWPLSVFCHVDLSNKAACFIKTIKEESSNKTDITILYVIIRDVTYSHLYCWLEANHPYSKGRDYTRT